MRDFGARLRARVRALSPNKILLIGWLVFLEYAYPGFMSFDSIKQLNEARWGYYIDGHPPAMAALWRFVELFVAGPLGMLLIQSTCFLIGLYLIFARFMTARRAAVVACIVFLFPPVAATMAVIWKDSQMAAFLVLGFGLILHPNRRMRVLGLVALVAATAMRHNALVMTGPLIVICFVWDPAHRFVKRHLISIAAWIGVTLAAQLITVALTDEKQYIWHTSLALCDMTTTLRYTPETIPDSELREAFTGLTVIPTHDLHAFARGTPVEGEADYIAQLWWNAYHMFELPQTAEQRSAVVAAWKKIVFGHFGAYLAYRWHVFSVLIGISDEPLQSPIYNWFTDVQAPYYSAVRAGHDAGPAKVQDLLRRGIHVIGATIMFHITLYVILVIVLLAFSFRDRRVFALLVSAVTSEAVLFVFAPTTDWRYSYWLVLSGVIGLVMLIAGRVRRDSPATCSS